MEDAKDNSMKKISKMTKGRSPYLVVKGGDS